MELRPYDGIGHLVGGHGADLMLYGWILISGLLGLNLHLRMRSESRRLTLLVRQIALENPERPPAKGEPPQSD